ncbi:MAG: sigma-70 family RNA polymerase sigma factor [Clostridium sp.]|nr:sigma-70 family RNA polymerase sigma factor [Clostridium sp.]
MRCNDKNYIQKLKNHEEDSLEYIVDKYMPLVKGITYKVLFPLRNECIIEECINDVFLSIWNNINKFKGDNEDFKKWLCAISKFKAIDYYRKESKQIQNFIDEYEFIGDDFLEDKIIVMENKIELMDAINSLDKMDKEIIILKFFLGFKSQDIATKFNVTKSSIDNKIYRSKKKLKEILKHTKLEVI